MVKFIQAGKFKAHCLKIMEEVKSTGQSITVTKRHIPIVVISPIGKKDQTLFGKMQGSIHIKGDLREPTGENWNADY